MTAVRIGEQSVGGGAPLVLIAGPCVLEDLEMALLVASRLRAATTAAGLGFVFKASFDKANRTAVDSPRGPGLDTGLAWLAEVRRQIGVPVTTDIHRPEQAAAVAEVVDLLQIPAFLCRQTDLVQAAAATGRPVNLKKGQFVHPEDMGFAVAKAREAGDGGVLLTERGSCFGHRDLVVDFRGLADLARHDTPVVFDATHSSQRPGGSTTLGRRSDAKALARAALAVGVDALFAEVHPEPERAWSDAATQLPLDELAPLIQRWSALDRARRALP